MRLLLAGFFLLGIDGPNAVRVAAFLVAWKIVGELEEIKSQIKRWRNER